MDGGRKRNALYSPRADVTSVMRKEGLAAMDPVEDPRDQEVRRIPWHVWAHLPRPVAVEPPTWKGQDQQRLEQERQEDAE